MKAFACLTLALALGLPAAAQDGIGDISIVGNQLRARLDLSPVIDADLTLTFEDVVGLTERSIGLSAELIDPLDPGILSRLPSSASIPSAFPVRLWIQPPVAEPLTFSGVVQIELYTHNLTYAAGTPLRLFAARPGGWFTDISAYMGTGSYRVRGSRGGFSEFLIILEPRLLATVINRKFDQLANQLSAYADHIEPQTLTELLQLHTDAEAAWQAGDRAEAFDLVEQFAEVARQHSGEDIPDVWRSDRNLVNVAGLLRATAATLRFSLNLDPGTPLLPES